MQKRTVWSEITSPTKRLAEEHNTIKLLTHRKYRHESCSYKRIVELRRNWVNKFRVLAKFENQLISKNVTPKLISCYSVRLKDLYLHMWTRAITEFSFMNPIHAVGFSFFLQCILTKCRHLFLFLKDRHKNDRSPNISKQLNFYHYFSNLFAFGKAVNA